MHRIMIILIVLLNFLISFNVNAEYMNTDSGALKKATESLIKLSSITRTTTTRRSTTVRLTTTTTRTSTSTTQTKSTSTTTISTKAMSTSTITTKFFPCENFCLNGLLLILT